MRLFIRSQNREKLIEFNGLVLYNPCFEMPDSETQICDSFEGEIATYKTKKRALEVLDEIQKLMQPIFSYTPIVKEKHDEETMLLPYIKHEQVGSKTEVIELSTCVYEMPKE